MSLSPSHSDDALSPYRSIDAASLHSSSSSSSSSSAAAASSHQLEFSSKHNNNDDEDDASDAAIDSSSLSTSPPSSFTPSCLRVVYASLGLAAQSDDDVLRVYMRLVALLFGVATFLYFLLTLAFSKWFNYPFIMVFLSLACFFSFVTCLLSLYTSRPSVCAPLTIGGLRLINAQLYGACFNPSPCMALLLSILLYFCMANVGFLNIQTELDFSSTRQIFSLLFLLLTSLFSVILQCFLFFLTKSYKKTMTQSQLLAQRDDIQDETEQNL